MKGSAGRIGTDGTDGQGAAPVQRADHHVRPYPARYQPPSRGPAGSRDHRLRALRSRVGSSRPPWSGRGAVRVGTWAQKRTSA